MRDAITHHWPEYLMEAAGLGIFMLSACVFGTLLGHPDSPLAPVLTVPLLMRALMGAAMGLSALALVMSPWGKRSGAHFNPAVTLTFFRLGKVSAWDAGFYVIAQFVGGIAGVALAGAILGDALAHPAVRYVVTVGSYGNPIAFAAEVAISFGLMGAILTLSNVPAWNRFTAFAAAALVASYITLEAPLSGMSMNPARTLASALAAQSWAALWVYFLAPPIGMLAAAECYLRGGGARRVLCAKLHHDNAMRCIFRCEYPHDPGGLTIMATARTNDTPHWHTTIVVADVDAASSALRGAGYVSMSDVVTLPSATLGFRRAVVVRDPDGHALQLVADALRSPEP